MICSPVCLFLGITPPFFRPIISHRLWTSFRGSGQPYAILVHCVGVCHYWIGTLIAGPHTDRDRPAEFQATGSAVALRAAVNDLKRQIRLDLRNVTPDVDEEQGLAAMPNAEYTPLPDRTHWTQGAVLMHTYEELAQHHGQMQLTRDILVQGRRQI